MQDQTNKTNPSSQEFLNSLYLLLAKGSFLSFLLKEPPEAVYFLACLAGTILCKEVKIINVKTRGCQASDPHSANTADLDKNVWALYELKRVTQPSFERRQVGLVL